jgi:hypothetical protein
LNWEQLPKPWTKEQCRQRYVEGEDDIGFRGLSELSGYSKSKIAKWAADDVPTWAVQRGQYRDRIRTETQQKTIDKTSERLSDDLSDISVANYEAHKLARDYAHTIFKIKAKHLQQVIKLPDEERLAELKKHSASDMNYWSLILSRSTQEIAAATGLPYYINANTAFTKLEKEGYIILNPQAEEEPEDED